MVWYHTIVITGLQQTYDRQCHNNAARAHRQYTSVPTNILFVERVVGVVIESDVIHTTIHIYFLT